MRERRDSDGHILNALRLEERMAPLVLKSLLVGLSTGACVAAYRWLLGLIESGVDRVYSALRAQPEMLPLWALATIGCAVAVGLIIRRNRMAEGSGIPQVTGLIRGYFDYPWLKTLLAKFSGGALAFCSGVALGREGPSIQMGACIADGIGGGVASSRTERKVLIAGGASAGLAAAFGAPLAGVLFAFEEIFRYISPALLLATTVSAVSADYVTNWALGMKPVFDFNVPAPFPLEMYWLLVALGVLIGLFGALYNRALIGLSQSYGGLWRRGRAARAYPLRPVPVFLLALPVGMLFPAALGSGNLALDKLAPATGLAFLAALLAIRFLFSVTSFASGAPGGIFMPLLILGGIGGGLFGAACIRLIGMDDGLYYHFVVLAMAGMFAATVRAPLTGIVLLTEMTGTFTHLLPITVVSIFAFVTAEILRSEPVYASMLKGFLGGSAEADVDDGSAGADVPSARGLLRRCAPRNDSAGADTGQDGLSGKHVFMQAVVHMGSFAEGRHIRELRLPEGCLFVSVKRGSRDLIPTGGMQLREGDRVLILCDRGHESKVRAAVGEQFEE